MPGKLLLLPLWDDPYLPERQEELQALKREITRYEIQGEELILYAGDDEVMRFTGVDLGKVE